MKFFSFATLSALLAASSVSAQQVMIASPAAGATMTSGSTINVRITRPPFQSSSTEVAVVIGFKSCVQSPNYCQIDALGTMLYNGLYRPTSQGSSYYQDIPVTIPAGTPSGAAVLNVVHFAMIGASMMPWSETLSPLNIMIA